MESLSKHHSANEKTMLESLEKADQSYQKLLQDNKKVLTQLEISQQTNKCLESNVNSLKTEVAALENRCKTYLQTIGKHEETINSLREVSVGFLFAESGYFCYLESWSGFIGRSLYFTN